MITIAVCDADPKICGMVEDFIERSAIKWRYEVDVYFSGESFLSSLGEGRFYDVVFLSLELPKVKGVQAGVCLRGFRQMADTVLICMGKRFGEADAALDSQPFRFLRFPIKEERFRRIWNAISERLLSQKQVFEFGSHQAKIRVPVKQIISFDYHIRVITIYTTLGSWTFYEKIEKLMERLGHYDIPFLRIHKSYIINMDYVREYSAKRVRMSNEKEYPISSSNRKNVKAAFRRFFRQMS
jgi:DNA-binding LytR/AlgR family response regulator